MKTPIVFILFCVAILACSFGYAQPITGNWKGKIGRWNVELKIVKNGDSLNGTSYYYASPNNFRRYSIKGYFDPNDNSAIWWDDQLIEEKSINNLLHKKASSSYISSADFNCPGGTKMYLTGKAALKDKPDEKNATVDLQKFSTPFFRDEWDYVIENYTVGANDPYLIDSIGKLAFNRPVASAVSEMPDPKRPENEVVVHRKKPAFIPVSSSRPSIKTVPKPVDERVAEASLTNEQKFKTRTRQLVQEIPVSGDSLELRFYDNAEIDGDSIAVFLNDKMLAEHIRLSDTAFIIKLPVAMLQPFNDLVMVAENLGSIPPNTSLMIAMVAGHRYEARLASTEGSSALVRFVRKETRSGQNRDSR